MSACPVCRATARHVAILVPWSPTGSAAVLHHCPECGERFTEAAHDLEAVKRRCVANLTKPDWGTAALFGKEVKENP